MAMTESPSVLLRRAADRLNELLAEMPQGPRRLEYGVHKKTGVLLSLNLYGPPKAGSNIETHRMYHASRRVDAEYDLVAQPDTMRDVAGMLRSAAVMTEETPEASRIPIVRHALSIAARILGERS